MAILTITVGLPGSGKTTYARALQIADSALVRVNRDDLRRMTYPRPDYSDNQEAAVTLIQLAAVRQLLVEGYSVIADDTNVRPNYVGRWRALAEQTGAELWIVNLTDVSVEECIRRQHGRPERDRVPERVIRAMAAQLGVSRG